MKAWLLGYVQEHITRRADAAIARSSASPKSPLLVDAQDAKFHLGLDIEEVDVFGLKPLE
jgi:hypothetical protein